MDSITGFGHNRSRLDRLLTPEQRARLQGITTVVCYPARDCVIYAEKQPADAIYLLNRGIVELSSVSRQGEKQIISFLHAGDLFGLFERNCYCSTTTTLTPVEVYRLPLEPLKELLVADARIQLEFLTKVADDLRRSHRQILVLGQHNVQQRLAVFLTGFIQSDQFYDPQAQVITLPLRRSDIANYLAVTQESIVRSLKQLEAAGVLERQSPKVIRIADMGALLRLASG